jgi:hypothetical protein
VATSCGLFTERTADLQIRSALHTCHFLSSGAPLGRITPFSEGGLPEGIGHGSRLKLTHYRSSESADLQMGLN